MHPTMQECEELYLWYKETFHFDDHGSIDCYFEAAFSSETCWIIKEGKDIVSMLCAHPHTMVLNGKTLPIIFVSGVITKEEKRGLGYMNKLFQSLFEDTMEHTALYVLQAYQPEIYARLGFIPTHFQTYVTYNGSSMPDTLRAVHDPSLLTSCAMQSYANQNGWLSHDEAFYAYQLKEAAAQGHYYFALFIEEILCAFARFHEIDESSIEIDELCAINEDEKQLFLAQLSSRYSNITYPLACSASSAYAKINLLTRIGNPILLSSLMDQKVTTIEDIIKKDQPYAHYGWW